MTTELKAIQDEILATTKGLFEGLKGTTEEQKEKLARMSTRLDDFEAEMRRPDQLPQRRELGGIAGYKTPGERFIEEKGALEDFARTRRVRVNIGGLWPDLGETKSLIDSAALGFSTPGILGSTRIEETIVPQARRRLTIRDLLRSKPVTTPQADFIKENVFTNNASPQAEGSTKAESTITFLPGSERIRTIAHFCHVSKQAVDDLPELQRFINETLVYGVKLREQQEILLGDDLGDHYNGIIPQATAYAGTYNVASDTRIDRLNWAILELAAADEQTTGIVLNPVDYHRILAIKDDTNGANSGNYVVGDPLGGVLQVPTLWGRPVVQTNSITAGRFLIGDFSRAILADRMDAVVDLSEENGTNFERNLLTIRCEMRGCVLVTRPSAFRYGQFT